MRDLYVVTVNTVPRIDALVSRAGFKNFKVSVVLTETSSATYFTDPAASLRRQFSGEYQLDDLPTELRARIEDVDAADLKRRQEIAAAIDADLVSVREDGKGRISFRFGGKDFTVTEQFTFGFSHPKVLRLSELLPWARAAALGDWERFQVTGGTATSGRYVTVKCNGSREDRRSRDRRKLEDVLRKSPHILEDVLDFARRRGFIK